MPNLLGIVEYGTDQDVLAPVLERMMKLVDIPEYRYIHRKALSSGAVFGNVLTGIPDNLSQPVFDASRSMFLMLDGEILGRDTLVESLQARGRDTNEKDDAELALLAYEVFGEDFLDHLNGRWNLVLHHTDKNLTIIASDRFGSRLLYLAHDAGRFVFASELKAVIAARKTKSEAGGYGLFELFAGPYLHGDRTWIEGIRVLNPGTVLRIHRGEVSERRYWKSQFNEGDYRGNVDDAAAEFREKLRVATRRAMRRKPHHPIAITLSGGLDSRSLALSVDANERPLSALTYGDADTPDVRFAGELAKVLGFDFHHVESKKEALFADSRAVLDEVQGPSSEGERGFYSTQIDRVTWRDEFFGDQTGVTSMIWHPLYCKHMNLMLQGACGDALTGSHIAWADMKGISRGTVIDRLFHEQYFQSKESLAHVFSSTFLAKHFGPRREIFERLFDDIDADEPVAISGIWDMENRQRRGAFSTFTMERYFCLLRVPYLDYDLAEYLCSLPPRWRFQQRVYKKMLVNGYPEAAHVPWAYTSKPMTDSPVQEFAREWFNYWKRRAEARFAAKKNQLPVYAFRDTAGLLRQDRPNALPVYQWLESEGFDEKIFNRKGIRRLLDRFYEGQDMGDEFMLVAYLCAFVRVDDYLLSGKYSEIPEACNPARYGVVGPKHSS